MKKRAWQTYLYAALGVAYECGRISGRAMEFFGAAPRWRYNLIAGARDDGLLRENRGRNAESGKSRTYELTSAGLAYLQRLNGARFRDKDKVEWLSGQADKLARARKRCEIVTMMKRAGYGTHEDDKPDLTDVVASEIEEYNRRRAGTRLLTDETILGALFRNAREFRYPGEQDQTAYLNRSTAVNCFYSDRETKPLAGSGMLGGTAAEMESALAVQYARSYGLLFTPNDVYRVFYTGDYAMTFQQTGEDAYSGRLSAAANLILPGRCVQEQNSVILPILAFGDGNMDAAKKLILFDDREAAERVLLYRKTYKIGNAAGTLMNTGNLGRPAIYIPVRREGIDVLAMLQFPNWRKLVTERIFETSSGLVPDANTWFDAGLPGGGKAVFFFDMDLTKLSHIKSVLCDFRIPQLVVLCASWAEDFVRELLEEECARSGAKLEINGIEGWHAEINEWLIDKWEVILGEHI